MPPIAYFGIESTGLTLAIDLLILFGIVLYGSLVYWTYADARRRIEDPMLIGCATAASLFPFVGTLVYMILRPPEYLEDVRERELEMHAVEARLHELDHSLCPHCDYRIERDFIRCPSCLRKLKERCASCSRPLDRTWTICPYCETEVADAKSARRSGRRAERTATGGAPGGASHAAVGASALAPETAAASAPARVAAREVVRAPDPARARRAEGIVEPVPAPEDDHDIETVAKPSSHPRGAPPRGVPPRGAPPRPAS